jgi:hypothetical protein
MKDSPPEGLVVWISGLCGLKGPGCPRRNPATEVAGPEKGSRDGIGLLFCAGAAQDLVLGAQWEAGESGFQ